MMGRFSTALLLAGAAFTTVFAPLAAPVTAQDVPAIERPMADAPYWDASLPVEARVADLLARMTLEEKIAQIISVWDTKAAIQNADHTFAPELAAQVYPHGIGQIARPSDTGGPSPLARCAAARLKTPSNMSSMRSAGRWRKPGWAFRSCSMRKGCMASPRRDATSFPQAIALASQLGSGPGARGQRSSSRARSVRAACICALPLWWTSRVIRAGAGSRRPSARIPILVGELGVAAVEGLQGLDRARTLAPGKVFATLKHLTGHGQPESGTNVGPAPVSERELRDNVLPAVRAGGARAPASAPSCRPTTRSTACPATRTAGC